MTSTKSSPLHLEAPRLIADAALGEHLAALARASAPSAASRVRRSGWRVPLAALATITASGSVAYAGQAALDGQTRTNPRPAASVTVAPTVTATASANATTRAALAALEHLLNSTPQGKATGHGHTKTGKAKGHPGKHDAGKHKGKRTKSTKESPASLAPIPHYGLSLWRIPAGSAGVSSP